MKRMQLNYSQTYAYAIMSWFFCGFCLAGGIQKLKKTKDAKKRGLRKALYWKLNPPTQIGQKHVQPEVQNDVEKEEEGVQEREVEYDISLLNIIIIVQCLWP